MLEGLEDVIGAGYDGVDGGGEGHDDFCGKPCESVRNPLCSSFPDPDAISGVGVGDGAGISAFNCMGRPRGACRSCFMHEDMNTRGCNRRAIEIKSAIDLGPS
jgi:hypothetical protein